MPGLEPSASDLLHALGEARSPDAGATERAWLQMQQRIVDGPPPMEIGPVVAIADRPRWITIVLATAVLAAAMVLVFVWGAWRATDVEDVRLHSAPYSSVEPDVAEQRSTTAPDVVAPNVVAPEIVAPEIVAPEIVAPAVTPNEVAADVAPTTAPRSHPTKRRTDTTTDVPVPAASPSAPKTTTLAAEMKLLAQANAAMRRGDAGAALGKLDEHRRSFVDGQLAPERDVARAVALCELGRRDAARAVVDAFAREHPGSPLRTKAEAVCRD